MEEIASESSVAMVVALATWMASMVDEAGIPLRWSSFGAYCEEFLPPVVLVVGRQLQVCPTWSSSLQWDPEVALVASIGITVLVVLVVLVLLCQHHYYFEAEKEV